MPRAKTKDRFDFPTTPLADRTKPDVRKRMSAPAMRTYFNVAEKWSLDAKEQMALLGSPAPSTFYKYKSGDVGTLSLDVLTRVSLILGMFKDLRILYPDLALADRWVKLPNANPIFGGKTPAQFMAQGDMDSLYQVRRLLDARRGGWS
jgi:Antitoxin Xre/MbcA/ParS C-terminal toxin-binding domain/Antitoxin Xre-like helix-turn-helix domain